MFSESAYRGNTWLLTEALQRHFMGLRKGEPVNAMYGLQHQVQTALTENVGVVILDSNGIITLRDSVSAVGARETAEAIARSVTGVVNVINELDVV